MLPLLAVLLASSGLFVATVVVLVVVGFAGAGYGLLSVLRALMAPPEERGRGHDP